MIKLGGLVKDSITGYEGIATAKCEYLTGCIQFQVQSKRLDKDGKTIEAEWFDQSRLDPTCTSEEKPGGPADTPPGRDVPPQ